jgi:ABC-type polysaccharide/polyol phosphate export permease
VVFITVIRQFLDNVTQFRYFGTTITNQNLIQEEIKRRLNSGNPFYHSVQNLLPSHLLSKNIKKVHKTTILPGSVWVRNLVSDIKGGTQTEGVREQGAVESIWTEER